MNTNLTDLKKQIISDRKLERELYAIVEATRPAFRAVETPEYLEAYEAWRIASNALDRLETEYEIQRREVSRTGG